MQSVFLLSLFSLIFLMFSGITAGLSQSIMQSNVEKSLEVEKMFSEVEVALNKIAFKEKDSYGSPIVDLTGFNLSAGANKSMLTGDFLPAHVSFAKRQLEKDPWGNKIHLLQNTEKVALWGGAGGQLVQAPVTTFLLISAGPNERYDFLTSIGADTTNPVLSEGQIKTVDIANERQINDDIIFRFSNYDSMMGLWQKAEEVDLMVKNVAIDYYKNMVDAFSPVIQLAQRDISRAGELKEDIFADLSDPDIGYDIFEDLAKGEGDDDLAAADTTTLVNEWFEDDDNDPLSDSSVYDVLIQFRTAKAYDGTEFRLAPELCQERPDSNPPERYKADPDTGLCHPNPAETSSEKDKANHDLNQEFINKYKDGAGVARKFTFPTFDILEKNEDGDEWSESEKGLKNLGMSGLETLDPFYSSIANGVGELSYSYDSTKPSKIKISRTVGTKDADDGKWYINKETEIDALGGL